MVSQQSKLQSRYAPCDVHYYGHNYFPEVIADIHLTLESGRSCLLQGWGQLHDIQLQLQLQLLSISQLQLQLLQSGSQLQLQIQLFLSITNTITITLRWECVETEKHKIQHFLLFIQVQLNFNPIQQHSGSDLGWQS